MTNKLKKNNGITLASVVATVMILIILSTMVTLRASESINTNKLNKMYNDIKILQDRALIYYSETGKIPIIEGSNFGTSSLGAEFQNQKNKLDNDNYYEIDLSKLDNITLSFGNKKNGDTADVYIVNEETLSVYYAKGIALNGKTYYTVPKDGQEVEITINPLEDKKNRKTIEEGLGIVNAPDLKQGMTPIVYANGSEQKVEDAKTDYWYDYSKEVKKFANMKLNDGSLYVWIPRFVTDSSGNIKFVTSENKWYNNSSEAYEDITGYTIPDVFNYNGQNLAGIWIAKYEASNENEQIVTILNANKTTERERWGRVLEETEKVDKTSNITLIEANGLDKTQNKSLLMQELDKDTSSKFLKYYENHDIEALNNNKYAICSGSSSNSLTTSNINTTDNFNFRPRIISFESRYDTTNENIAYKTLEGVPIPKGFHYLMGTKDTGLVITADYKGREGKNDEFVWIPVEDYSKFKRYDWSKWDGVSDISTLSLDDNPNYKEAGPKETDISTFESEAMYSSVKTYEGFYVARYEIIIDNYPNYPDAIWALGYLEIPKSMSTKKFDFTTNAIRAFIIPFQFSSEIAKPGLDGLIGDDTQYGIVRAARSMYPDMEHITELGLDVYKDTNKANNETGVNSTLIYGVQWDAMMRFLSGVDNPNWQNEIDGKTNPNYDKIYPGNKRLFILDSWGMGNYTYFDNDALLEMCRTTDNCVKNIYDLAGNLSDWTMEAGFVNIDQTTGEEVWGRVARGGSSERSRNEQHIDASGRLPYDMDKIKNGVRQALCGRAALYIKE